MKRRFGNIITVFLSLGLISGIWLPSIQAASKDTSGIKWSTLSDLQSVDLNDIAFNNDHVYVTVGDDGTIMHSRDGKQWLRSSQPNSLVGNVESLATNGEKFVAVGSNGILLNSKNGITWSSGQLVNAPVNRDFYRYYDNTYPKKYSLVGWGQKVKLSDFNFSDIIWDGKRYVAVGTWQLQVLWDHPTVITQYYTATSSDGVKWSIKPLKYDNNKLKKINNNIYPTDPYKINFNGTKYVILAGQVAFSSPTISETWEAKIPGGQLNDVLIHNGSFITNTKQDLLISKDGLKWNKFDGSLSLINKNKSTVWSEQSFFEGKKINKIINDGKQHIAITDDGFILLKDALNEDYDQTDWTIVRETNTSDFTNIVFDGKGRYVATGYKYISFMYSTASIWESTNGYDWAKTEIEDASDYMQWTNLASGNGSVIAYGTVTAGPKPPRNQYLFSSKKGEWELKKFPSFVNRVDGIYWVKGQFYVAVNGGFITSKDGINWSKLNSSNITMTKIAASNSYLLGLRAPNTQNEYGDLLYNSKDFTSWKKSEINLNKFSNEYWLTSNSFSDINWNGKQFAVLGDIPAVATSTNGLTWKTNKTISRLNRLAWNGQLYVASARSDGNEVGKMYYSYNGLNYSQSSQVTNQNLKTDVIWDGEKFIVGGENGTILIGEPSK
ncbi:hypothetical protein MH215_10260 [Paenibacillus sp. ACRSA]|uniref:hypothetical protein n=1 Tax=Paenibacillus sp. ACRSA TaxID=2918211 RepID=UPI001EF73302|nr:hypothetical protein [Paenibacillus sp. ACRSA]MCG7377379.1 hypothetical protein [Paenibacillus sp. ACRSA]